MNPKPISEAHLFKSMKLGDEQALAQIISLHEEALIAYLYVRTRDLELSKDLCQESFLKLIRKPPTFLTNNSLKAWLFRVAYNLLIDHSRKRIARAEPEDISLRCPASELSLKQDYQLALECLKELPQNLQDTLRLRLCEEQSFHDIAKLQNIPIGTALWRVQSGLSRLRMLIRKKGVTNS